MQIVCISGVFPTTVSCQIKCRFQSTGKGISFWFHYCVHICCSWNWNIFILNTLEKHICFTYRGQNPYCTIKLGCVYELKMTTGYGIKKIWELQFLLKRIKYCTWFVQDFKQTSTPFCMWVTCQDKIYVLIYTELIWWGLFVSFLIKNRWKYFFH